MQPEKSKQQQTSLKLSRTLFIQTRKQNILDVYDFEPKELGRGAYGVVYKAKYKQRQTTWRAIKKIYKKSIRNPLAFRNQVQILKSLDHPNIIKIYETYEDQSNVYLVTDLCEGGEVFDRLDQFGNFSEDDARVVFRQIAEAINYCHVQKIAHRDLKPQNFIFNDKKSLSLKLIDFGLSYRYQKDMKQQLLEKKQNKLIGTAYYIAPQIIYGQYDQRCDIWSMGVILYILLTAVPPFDGDSDRQIIQSVRKRHYTFGIPQMKKVSDSAKDLIAKILVQPDNRLTIQQIFKHQWLNNKQSSQPLKINFSKLIMFCKFSKLKTLAVTYIAAQLSDAEIKHLGELFKQIDLNHDGYLTVQQLKQALENQKQKASLYQLKKLMDYIDTDKNGKINYTQFVASCLQNSLILKQQNLKMVFKMLDKDNSGTVSSEELKFVIKQMNIDQRITTKIIDQILKTCDNNNDGSIDYEEFLKCMYQSQ